MGEENERWLPYPGFAGFYETSDLGRVFSLPRTTTPGGLLVLRVSSWGYHVVTLSKYGVHYERRVAKMVLETFGGSCLPGQEARHGPYGQLDDRLINLCWGTRSQNQGEDRKRDGTSNQGERCGSVRLTEAIVLECRRRYAAGETQTLLAAEFGVDQSVISDAVRGKTWTHLAGAVVKPNIRPGAKLTESVVLEIRRRYTDGETQAVLAREFNVAHSTVSHAVHGRRWAHLEGAVSPEEDGRSRPRSPELEAKRADWGRQGAEKRWAGS